MSTNWRVSVTASMVERIAGRAWCLAGHQLEHIGSFASTSSRPTPLRWRKRGARGCRQQHKTHSHPPRPLHPPTTPPRKKKGGGGGENTKKNKNPPIPRDAARLMPS